MESTEEFEECSEELAVKVCYKRCLNRPYMAYQAGFIDGQRVQKAKEEDERKDT